MSNWAKFFSQRVDSPFDPTFFGGLGSEFNIKIVQTRLGLRFNPFMKLRPHAKV